MKTTIDAAGRLVIPKKIREAAGLEPGMTLDVRYQDGRIEIEPASVRIKLVREGQFLVAVPCEDVPPLRSEDVEQIREAIWRERAGGQ